VRVLDAGSTRGAPKVHARVRGAGVDVTVTAPAATGKLLVAKRVLARWTGTPRPEHLRVRFTRLLVRGAMDPGCAGGQATCGSKETTHGEQVSSAPEEWNVYLDVGGHWTVWGSGLLRARDGQVFRHGPVNRLGLLRTRIHREQSGHTLVSTRRKAV
jgi:hypothetical protein